MSIKTFLFNVQIKLSRIDYAYYICIIKVNVVFIKSRKQTNQIKFTNICVYYQTNERKNSSSVLKK